LLAILFLIQFWWWSLFYCRNCKSYSFCCFC